MSAPARQRFKVQMELLKYYYLIVEAETEEAAEAIAERDLATRGIASGWVYLPEYDITSIYNVEDETAP